MAHWDGDRVTHIILILWVSSQESTGTCNTRRPRKYEQLMATLFVASVWLLNFAVLYSALYHADFNIELLVFSHKLLNKSDAPEWCISQRHTSICCYGWCSLKSKKIKCGNWWICYVLTARFNLEVCDGIIYSLLNVVFNNPWILYIFLL